MSCRMSILWLWTLKLIRLYVLSTWMATSLFLKLQNLIWPELSNHGCGIIAGFLYLLTVRLTISRSFKNSVEPDQDPHWFFINMLNPYFYPTLWGYCYRLLPSVMYSPPKPLDEIQPNLLCDCYSHEWGAQVQFFWPAKGVKRSNII